MIVVTGAYGFIGSNMVEYLNSIGRDDLILIDPAQARAHTRGYARAHDVSWERETILPDDPIDAVIHLGAISDTLEKDKNKIDLFNVKYTAVLSDCCKERGIPMVFASSAAVYGNGNGPLNLYAESKLQSEKDISDHAVCFRLFNVYGKNESHKGRMSSVILKWWNELMRDGCIRIFEGSESFKRDFIHVQDVCRILWNGVSMSAGVYDLGTGISHSFDSLADMVLSTHGSGQKVHIPMPEDLRSQYQTDTKAAASPFIEGCISLSDGVNLYCNYLKGIS